MSCELVLAWLQVVLSDVKDQILSCALMMKNNLQRLNIMVNLIKMIADNSRINFDLKRTYYELIVYCRMAYSH
uniref:Putative secreted protein n=1 Tax=Panstrongylus lignarius TaxID=156445 RepID=A0A224XTZ5_9HEMI